jgi:hypothetical protein
VKEKNGDTIYSKINNPFDGDIPNPNNLQFGISLGVGYEIPLRN